MLTLQHTHIPRKIYGLWLSCGIFIFMLTSVEAWAQRAEEVSPIGQSLTGQAQSYRHQGYQLQSQGDLDGALSYYIKATEIDSGYALAYNDAGVIYEAKGQLDDAERAYLKALSIDPYLISVYSNLGALYETKRDLNKASYYWGKRVKQGSPSDPWTLKAKQRLRDIYLVLGYESAANEQDVLGLMEDVSSEKSKLRENDKELAKLNLNKAKRSYSRNDLATAFKQAIDAQQLDPENSDIAAFIEKIQLRALSR